MLTKRVLERTYGLAGPAAYAELLRRQGWACAICRRSFREMNGNARHLDHDHRTGRVRGILCMQCNAMLGMARDERGILRAAISYLAGSENRTGGQKFSKIRKFWGLEFPTSNGASNGASNGGSKGTRR